MKIRSVTAFIGASYPLDTVSVARAGEALRAARDELSRAGYEVQTTRLATQPFPAVLSGAGPASARDFAQDVAALAFVHEIDYVSLGPVRLEDPATYLDAVIEILSAGENIFASAEIANRAAGVSLSRVHRAAMLVRRVGTLDVNEFANLRLAALANVPPWAPFFPAAYHGGGAPRIAVATESADLAVSALGSAGSLADARETLIRAVELETGRIEAAMRRAAEPYDVVFQGIDFSLAPYPEESRSIGTALERLGLTAFGVQGSLMASAFLTDTLDRARFTRTGFCGLMLPVLEDAVLARRAAEKALDITGLLAFSAVCGTGLDTIPLPGDTSPEVLASILMDVAALALRLDKPLTARLMPLPGKQAGDQTGFDFEYFANSRVMDPGPGAASGLLAGDENVLIRSRPGAG